MKDFLKLNLLNLLNSSFEASTSATRSIKSRISSFKEPPPFSLRSSKASCALLMASLYSFSASCNRYENQFELNLSTYLFLTLYHGESAKSMMVTTIIFNMKMKCLGDSDRGIF